MKLHIVVDLDDNLDATLIDPHAMADELLHYDLPAFDPGALFSKETDFMPTKDVGDISTVVGAFVSAEWDS